MERENGTGRGMILFLNGRFMDENEAAVSTADRGFTLGDGVFDTFLAVDGQPRFAARHQNRLLEHAQVMGIATGPLGENGFLIETARTLLRENGCGAGRFAIRTTLTRGPGPRGLAPPVNPADISPTLCLRVSPAADPADLPPVHAVIAQTVRRNEGSPLSRVKSLNCGDNLIALLEARETGANEAILLNNAGYAACATAANIFISEGGRLVTPRCADGAMNGIVRTLVLERGGAVEDKLPESRLMQADALFTTNSLAGIRPVRRLGERIFAPESAEAVLRFLSEIVGPDGDAA